MRRLRKAHNLALHGLGQLDEMGLLDASAAKRFNRLKRTSLHDPNTDVAKLFPEVSMAWSDALMHKSKLPMYLQYELESVRPDLQRLQASLHPNAIDPESWSLLQQRGLGGFNSLKELPGVLPAREGDDPLVDMVDSSYQSWKHTGNPAQALDLGKNLLGGSYLKPNFKLAREFFVEAAKKGNNEAAAYLWNEFGESDEWHSDTFLYDREKASSKLHRELQSVGVDLQSFSSNYARAKEASVKGMHNFSEGTRELRQYMEREGIDSPKTEEQRLVMDAIQQKIDSGFASGRQANKDLHELRQSIRGNLIGGLAKLQQSAGTQLPHHRLQAISNRITNPSVRVDMAGDKPAPSFVSDARQRFRQQVREGHIKPAFKYATEMADTMQELLSVANRNIFHAGQFDQLKFTVDVKLRANATKHNGGINLDVEDHPRVAAHEFGHHIEFQNPRIAARNLEFLDDRTDGKTATRLPGYDDDEAFREGGFYAPYVGKRYADGSTEVSSMGVEALFDENTLIEALAKDPEHIYMTIASLRGY